MKNGALNARLLCAAELTRQDATFADIGTDHAKLPVHLVQTGRVQHAFASDIGEGPIARARAYINACGLSDRIGTFIGDGIAHLPITAPAGVGFSDKTISAREML